MARFLGWVVAREADVVLGVSRDITNWMSGLGARQVERALVPAPTLKPPTANRKQTRKQLGLTDNEPVLLTVARLAPQKGVPLLLDTAARLTEQTAVKPVWLVAGEGPLRVAAEKTALEHALPIRFLGRRHDVANLYGAADLVVGTSYWEGQPVALQEALAQGCAVVATAVGGTAETVGSGAELVAPEPGRLAEAIIRLLNHPEQLTDLRHRAACQAARLPSEQSLLQQLDRLGGTESGPSDHI
jgi:glycosyltransferase involved in cell wall biosynthesis